MTPPTDPHDDTAVPADDGVDPSLHLPLSHDEEQPKARVAIIGAGAIGLTIAAELSPDRALTTVYRRTVSDVDPIVNYPDGTTRTITARQVTDPADAEIADWVLIATKAHQTSGTSDWLARTVSPDTTVVILQNGIDHAARLPIRLRPEQILPTIVHTVAVRTADGVNVLARNRVLTPAGPRATRLMQLFREPTIVRADEDFAANAWRKLILNTAFNTITTITGAPASVLARPALSSLVFQALEEGVEVATASGVTFDREEPLRLYATIADLPPDAVSSMRRDHEAGGPLERRYLSGTLIEAARHVGVATPTVDTLDALLSALAASPHPQASNPRTDRS